MEKIIAIIPLLPLLSFLIIALAGKKLPKSITTYLAPGSVAIAFLLSFYLLIQQLSNPITTTVNLFDWINIENLYIPFGFLVDNLTVTFLVIITGIGCLIHIYSTGYMHEEKDYNRFFAYLNLFIFFMLLLVMGNNFLIMFIGWEGVGLCSYLLIGFWYQNKAYSSAANKAFIMNRIGDLGFLLGIILCFGVFGSIIFTDIFSSNDIIITNGRLITAITLLLFVGAMGKSAQIPLYTWLPDAMAGPTPVSALIHAATMVTAGIYLVARCSVLFNAAPITSNFIAIIGVSTSLLAATIAIFQNDIKKVLAYSTVSQLGLIFLSLGVGAYTAGVFHVVTHAFFKALLFLGAGSVIHGMSGEQDIRSMGGLKSKMPITHKTFLIGTIAISGIPPLAGFFSKDQILASVFEGHKVLFVLGLLASLMTVFYMFRLYFLTFHGKFRGTNAQEIHVHESPKSMTIPLLVLAVLSVVGGFIGFPHELGKLLNFSNGIDHFLLHNISQQEFHIGLNTELALMAITLVLIAIMVYIAWQLFVKKESIPSKEETEMSLGKQVIYHKYYIDELYDIVIVKPIDSLAQLLYQFFEKLGLDGFINTMAKSVKRLSEIFKLTQNGNLSYYLITIVIAIVLIISVKYFQLLELIAK
ncbi:MAG: NADH-quinone oxidoreductase subunit L [Chitinophagales bacterium]|nr:NADH-quinone oxidoreductase subunit L [Chitinophagales bacterium]